MRHPCSMPLVSCYATNNIDGMLLYFSCHPTFPEITSPHLCSLAAVQTAVHVHPLQCLTAGCLLQRMEQLNFNDSESEIEMLLGDDDDDNDTDWIRRSRRGSVRMKALMLEINFPVQPSGDCEVTDRGSGYNYGQKWSYLNGKNG